MVGLIGRWGRSRLLVSVGLGWLLLWGSQTCLRATEPGVTNPNLQPSSEPLDLVAVKTGKVPPWVQTNATVSTVGLTLPSLWWTETQVIAQAQTQNQSPVQLLDRWFAYPIVRQQPGRVDVIVNHQLWSMLAYMERYEFLNELGTTARSYGYNLRVFDIRGASLGAYTCDLTGIPLPPAPAERQWLRSRAGIPCAVDLGLSRKSIATKPGLF